MTSPKESKTLRDANQLIDDLLGRLEDASSRISNLEASEGQAPLLFAILEDQKAQNTNGGTFTSGADQTRDLNTEVYDPNGIVSISANQFTLVAGTYLIRWSAPAFNVGRHQTFLYDITGAAELKRGQSEITAGGTVQTISTGSYIGTWGSSNTFEIRHRCQNTVANNGFGVANNFGTEVYTRVEITKIG